MNLLKKISGRFSVKEILILMITLLSSVALGICSYIMLSKHVTIHYDGKVLSFNTTSSTLKDVIKKSGIKLSEDDYLSVPINSRLKRENEVVLKRAVPVYINLDSAEKKVMTFRDTIREVLEQEGIFLGEKDLVVSHGLDDKVEKDMCIKILTVKEVYETENEKIPFKVVERENDNLDKGTKRIIIPGKEGLQENQFKIVLQGGLEVARQLVKSAVITSPVDEVIEYGTALTHKTSRGDILRYKKVMNMRATAYTASFKDTGKHPDHPQFGITYTGIKAKKGIIAVDPKVIKLGTKVYVEVAGNTPDYGYALAADIGGAIKGDLIDLYLDDQETVDQWGVKRVKVYILSEQ